MSIRWIRNVVVAVGKPPWKCSWAKKSIADKCYIRVNQDEEFWFRPASDNRQSSFSKASTCWKSRFDGQKK